ncbi:MAG: ABC transporter permease, partial [Clostridia bacterium]|nr:ABC transporter permease [Clostridia bacterium]
MIIIRYFFMELKRTAVVMRRSIFRILIGLFLLCGAVMLIAATQQNQHTFQKLKVAIVLPDQNEITDMAVNLISTMDSIKSVCSFSYCTKEEAVSGIEQGNYQAAMLLTKDMYQDINSGINTPARILFAESDATEMIVFRELLRDGVWMLRTCESGVYAYLAYLYYNQVPTINDIGTLLAQRYMTVIFDRETL